MGKSPGMENSGGKKSGGEKSGWDNSVCGYCHYNFVPSISIRGIYSFVYVSQYHEHFSTKKENNSKFFNDQRSFH